MMFKKILSVLIISLVVVNFKKYFNLIKDKIYKVKLKRKEDKIRSFMYMK